MITQDGLEKAVFFCLKHLHQEQEDRGLEEFPAKLYIFYGDKFIGLPPPMENLEAFAKHAKVLFKYLQPSHYVFLSPVSFVIRETIEEAFSVKPEEEEDCIEGIHAYAESRDAIYKTLFQQEELDEDIYDFSQLIFHQDPIGPGVLDGLIRHQSFDLSPEEVNRSRQNVEGFLDGTFDFHNTKNTTESN